MGQFKVGRGLWRSSSKGLRIRARARWLMLHEGAISSSFADASDSTSARDGGRWLEVTRSVGIEDGRGRAEFRAGEGAALAVRIWVSRILFGAGFERGAGLWRGEFGWW